MRYLVLLYDTEDDPSELLEGALAEELRRYEAFEELAGDAVVGGEALAPSSEAATIRTDGGTSGTDDPDPRATEVLGGFYVVEVDDLDAAIDLAAEVPVASHGTVEVRPLVDWSERTREPLPDGVGRFLVLLEGPEIEASEPGSPGWDAAVAGHTRFREEAGDAVLGGGALHLAGSAVRVRVRDGERLVTDGPVAEATEVIGGVYLVAATGRDAAVDLARRIPMGPEGRVEVRPILDLDDGSDPGDADAAGEDGR